MKEQVSYTTTIKEGQRVRIHPSYTMAGIQKGDVRIVGIYEPKDFEPIKGLREAVKEEVQQVKLMDLGEDYLKMVTEGDWVGYAYTRGQEAEVQYLPLDTFMVHITTC